MNFFKNFLSEESGQDMVEYSLLLGFIALAGIAVYSSMRDSISTIWTNADAQLQLAAGAGGGD